MKVLHFTWACLFIASSLFAAETPPPTSQLLPTRCVTADGTAYESCGGTVDLSGSSVNITGGGVDIQDGASFTEGTTHVNQVGGVRNDTESGTVAEDKAAAFRITPHRALHVNLRDPNGTEIGTNAAPVRTDPVGTTTQPVLHQGYTSLVTGQQTVTTSAVALPSNSGKAVCVENKDASTQNVYYGPSGVSTSTGYELIPGASVCMSLDNSSRIYIVSGSSGAAVAFKVLN